MTKKQGNALPAGIYKVFWKRGGWSWATIGTTVCLLKTGKHGWPRMAGFDRDIRQRQRARLARRREGVRADRFPC